MMMMYLTRMRTSTTTTHINVNTSGSSGKSNRKCSPRKTMQLTVLLAVTAAVVMRYSNNNSNNNHHHQHYQHHRFVFCSAFASTSSSSSSSSSSNTNTNGVKYTNGIPDPPPPVLKAPNKKKRPPQHRDIQTPIPITILSGFLGSGKTTLLQNILLNSDGLRIAVIVNDVASINIDSKFIKLQQMQGLQEADTDTSDSSTTHNTAIAAAGIVELQNGCACCSKSEELLLSIADMVTLNDMKRDDEQFDHIVIELSGIANPINVRSMFHDAMLYQMPLLDRIVLDTMITVVDCSTVMDYIHSPATANRMEAPELFDTTNRNDDDDAISAATDDLIALFGNGKGNAITGDNDDDDDDGTNEGVAELIVAQIETSDVIIMNKIDLIRSNTYENSNNYDDCPDDQDQLLNRVTDLLYSLNPRANHIPSVRANVLITSVLGVAKGQGVALAGILDDHKDAVQLASSSTIDATPISTATTPTDDHHHHHHHNDHKNGVETNSDAMKIEVDASNDPVCTDPTHSHNHDHSHHHKNDQTETSSTCNDPICTDPTHDHHHHHHDHSDSSSTTQHAGIGSFVYRARRPFHPQRLYTFFRQLPIQRGLPSPQQRDDNDDEDSSTSSFAISTTTQRIMQRIIRSKGFVWCANSNIAALYISQAGTNFDLSCLGSWWATLPRSQWPTEAIDTVLQDFDSVDHIEPMATDGDDAACTTTSSVGDRRQELVFIGSNLGTNQSHQQDIARVLDQCILNDTEYALYCKSKHDESTLSNLFPSVLPIQQISY